MAVIDPPSVEDVQRRFDLLLARANEIKPSSAIEPHLPTSAFTGHLGLVPDEKSSKSHSTAVEIVARRVFQVQVANASNLDTEFGNMWNLLDILQILGDQDHCEPSILWYIVEELLDSRSIEGCRVIFDYLESRRERLVAKSFKKVNLVILRACNELLRRLSRAEDAVFCGRVFIFVFQSFPLGDKSSVNRHGDYNVDNVTTFDEEPQTKPEQPANEDSSMIDVEVVTNDSIAIMESNEKSSMSFDELHPRFWGLQKTFAYPPTIFEPTLLADFKIAFSATLTKFNGVPKVMSAPVVETKHGIKRKSEDPQRDEIANNFNPKYLTSRELFELELSDLSFQRHILVQAMILLEFLLSFTEKAKKKMHARTQQKYQFTLSEEDTEWVDQTKKAVVASLREGQDGPAFVRMVETVLSRDKNWVRWKEANCPDISLPGVDPKEYSHATQGARAATAWKRLRPTPIQALDLKFLSESEHNRGVDTLSEQERYLLPQAETLVTKVATVELDLEMAFSEEETQSLQQLKASNVWRTLRVASIAGLSRFDKFDADKNLDALLDNAGQEQAPPANSDEVQDGEGAAIEDEGNTTANNDIVREAGATAADNNVSESAPSIPVTEAAQ